MAVQQQSNCRARSADGGGVQQWQLPHEDATCKMAILLSSLELIAKNALLIVSVKNGLERNRARMKARLGCGCKDFFLARKR